MADFRNFFLTKKSPMDNCFVCSNTGLEGKRPFTDIGLAKSKQKEKQFFDIDKVLRDMELREIRQQTLSCLREEFKDPQPLHKKNTRSINMVRSSQQSSERKESKLKRVESQGKLPHSQVSTNYIKKIQSKRIMQPPMYD
mmetsp:Transcript_39940/g.38492  ORF Transcript_39940/g.38492 Transcript_39940/m.38492 type:complete len:140 (+) Transcript_39940:2172-2591(+)